MSRIGLGVGLIATVLLPVALLLFGVLGGRQTLSAILLLSGLWALTFGVSMARREERLYYAGSGAVAAILSTFLFVPLAYTAGLAIVALVILALVQALAKPASPSSPQKG